jgi:hypothetical protein
MPKPTPTPARIENRMNMTDELLGQLQGKSLGQISQQLGITPGQASTALAAALPLLIGALGHNSRQPQGAESLFGALQRDHVGHNPEDVLDSALTGAGDGEKILGHIFGAREPLAAQGLGVATGLQPDMANKVLRLLAPVALGYIAKKMFDRRQAKTSPRKRATAVVPPSATDLGDVLRNEEVQITRQDGVGGKLLGAVLDRNHDGKVDLSDLMAGLR